MTNADLQKKYETVMNALNALRESYVAMIPEAMRKDPQVGTAVFHCTSKLQEAAHYAQDTLILLARMDPEAMAPAVDRAFAEGKVVPFGGAEAKS